MVVLSIVAFALGHPSVLVFGLTVAAGTVLIRGAGDAWRARISGPDLVCRSCGLPKGCQCGGRR